MTVRSLSDPMPTLLINNAGEPVMFRMKKPLWRLKAILMPLALICGLALSACFPGLYTSRQPAGGMVVDAVTHAPLFGVQVFYQGEAALTDESGMFSFAKRTGVAFFHIGGEHPAWPHWGHYPLRFSKQGYVSLGGPLWSVGREDGKIALEPASVADDLAALDTRISKVRNIHREDGSELVWLTVEHPGEFGTFEEVAQETWEIAEKVVRSRPADASPDLAFAVCQYGKNVYGDKAPVWYVYIGWTGEDLSKTNRLRHDAKQWLNRAAFVELFQAPADAFAEFAAAPANRSAYGPFIEKVRAKEHMPRVFYMYGLPGSMF